MLCHDRQDLLKNTYYKILTLILIDIVKLSSFFCVTGDSVKSNAWYQSTRKNLDHEFKSVLDGFNQSCHA